MRSNLAVLMATLAFAGPACAIAATPAASASAATSSPPSSVSSGGFVSSGNSGNSGHSSSSGSSGSSNGSARSSYGSGGGGWTGHNSGGGGGWSGHSGAGSGSGARGFVSEGGFSRTSGSGFNRSEFAGAHGSMSSGGQQLQAMHSLAHGAAIAVHSDARARPTHLPHRPRPEYNFACGTRGAGAACYAGLQYSTPIDTRWWYCSESTPAIERTLYCDRIEKTKVGGR
jgi:hypothetical protein